MAVKNMKRMLVAPFQIIARVVESVFPLLVRRTLVGGLVAILESAPEQRLQAGADQGKWRGLRIRRKAVLIQPAPCLDRADRTILAVTCMRRSRKWVDAEHEEVKQDRERKQIVRDVRLAMGARFRRRPFWRDRIGAKFAI